MKKLILLPTYGDSSVGRALGGSLPRGRRFKSCSLYEFKNKTMKKVLLLSMIALVSCKPENEVQDTSNQVVVETIQVDDTKNTNEIRLWSSSETDLPEGTVYAMDCANCQSEDGPANSKDNYVTVKRPNNYLTVVKDIDEDLYLNLQIGDVIQ